MKFITDHFRINQKLVRKTYSSPIIGKTIQQLEGFEYAAELYLNMVYYTIRITSASQDMTTIVSEFGKFRYNHLLMVLCASGYIFQAKVDQLLGNIEGIGDILVLNKDYFKKHTEYLKMIFVRLRATGLKVNAKTRKLRAR